MYCDLCHRKRILVIFHKGTLLESFLCGQITISLQMRAVYRWRSKVLYLLVDPILLFESPVYDGVLSFYKW